MKISKLMPHTSADHSKPSSAPRSGSAASAFIDFSRWFAKTQIHWVTTYAYAPDGSITRPNGTVRTNTYNAGGQLTQFEEKTSGGTVLVSMTFTYDNDGNIISRLRNPQQQTFTGGLPQLVGAANTYNDDNQLTKWYNNSFTVTNDMNGNMTNGPLSLTGTASNPVLTFASYAYDTRNRLTGADNVTYTYDAENNRTAMTVTPSSGSAVTTNYTIDPHGDALPRVVKRTKSGATTYYVYGIGLLYQVTTGETETPLYYHFDNLGSTAAITNASQTVTDRAEYGIYGHTTYRSGTTDTPFLYVGQFGIQTDPNTLHYMRARYYTPLIQRFINADPIGFAGGSNWYAYANNSPLMFIDGNGEIPILAVVAIGALAGVAIQGISDLITGNEPKWENYAASAVGGAVSSVVPIGGSIVRGDLAGATFGASASVTRQGIGYMEGEQTEFDFQSFAVEASISAAGGAVGAKVLPAILRPLSNQTKGKLGETTSLLKHISQGEYPSVSQIGIENKSGRTAIWDWQFTNVFTRETTIVESKFGTSDYTPAQRIAAPYISNLVKEKWTYEFWGSLGGRVGIGFGGTFSICEQR